MTSRASMHGARWFVASAALAAVVAIFDAAIAFALNALLGGFALIDTVAVTIAVFVGLVVARGVTQLAFVTTSHLGRESLMTALRRQTARSLVGGGGDDAAVARTTIELVEIHPRAVHFAQLRAAAFAYSAQIALLALAAVVIAPAIAPPALIALGATGFGVQRLGRRLRDRAAAGSESHRAFLSDLARLVRILPLVRALRLERRELDKLDARIRDHAARARSAAELSSVATALPTLLGAPVLAATLAVAIAGGTPVSSSIALVLVLVRVVLVGSSLATTWSGLRTSAAGFEAVHRAAPPPELPPERPRATGEATPPAIRAIDVEVRPQPERAPVRVSFEVAPGQHLGIVGPSGSGKTTLLAAILGRKPIAAGQITIGESSPDAYLQRAHGRVGYVGPEPFLFAATIRENLVFAATERVDDARLVEALDCAAVRPVIDALPGGLDFVLGEDGAPLSSGERQRLAVARALVVRPSLLVLDEPTAHVDVETERLVLDAVRALRPNTTCVIAVHRRDLVAHCDTIVSLPGT